MEELALTDPIVVPEKVTNKYKVIVLSLVLESPTALPNQEQGLVQIQLKDNLGATIGFSYIGKEATDLIKWMNTANFSVNSMHKRILQKLSADGKLVGTVVGAPDPPVLRDDNGI
jgi:hypothetical protein